MMSEVDVSREAQCAHARHLRTQTVINVVLRSFPELVRLDAGGLERAAVALELLLHQGR